jgi:hypothetical protein
MGVCMYLCVTNAECLISRWKLCGLVTKGAVNGLLLVIFVLLLAIYTIALVAVSCFF